MSEGPKMIFNNAGRVQTPISTLIIFIHSLIFSSIFQCSLPWSSALLLYLFTISNPFFSQSVSWPSVCDQAHPGTGVELLMPGEAERWFHCVFSCGDGWLSEAARGVLGRRASVENKYTCLLLMHRATLTAMQIKHSPPPNCLQYYSPIPTWIPTSQTLSHPPPPPDSDEAFLRGVKELSGTDCLPNMVWFPFVDDDMTSIRVLSLHCVSQVTSQVLLFITHPDC